jgi:hypothetical protein
MVILFGTGMFGISVMGDFSSSLSIFLRWICGFNPFPKLTIHKIALMIVQTIRMIVRTAKVVRDRRAGRYVRCRDGWYIRTSLNKK